MEEEKNRQSVAAAVLSAAAVIGYGTFLLLCGVNVIPLSAGDLWLSGALVMLGLCAVFYGFAGRSVFCFWIAWVFFTVAAALLLNTYTELTLSKTYPLFIAAPALASLFSIPLSKAKAGFLKAFVFFGGLAGILFLNSFGALNIWITVPMLVIVGGGLLFIGAVTRGRLSWDSGDRPQDANWEERYKKEKEAEREAKEKDKLES